MIIIKIVKIILDMIKWKNRVYSTYCKNMSRNSSKMKLGRVSMTVPKELLEKSDKIAKEELEDRSTVMRELLALGLEHKM